MSKGKIKYLKAYEVSCRRLFCDIAKTIKGISRDEMIEELNRLGWTNVKRKWVCPNCSN